MEVKFSFLLFRVFISLIKMQSDIDRKSNLMKPEILAQWWRTLPHSLPGEKTQTGGVGAHERGIQRVASGGGGMVGVGHQMVASPSCSSCCVAFQGLNT